VPVLATGAGGSLTTFAKRGIGDVFISWGNEAHLASKELGEGKFDIVMPSISILAEPPVAIVDRITLRRKTTDIARAYHLHANSYLAKPVSFDHFSRLMQALSRYWTVWNARPGAHRAAPGLPA